MKRDPKQNTTTIPDLEEASGPLPAQSEETDDPQAKAPPKRPAATAATPVKRHTASRKQTRKKADRKISAIMSIAFFAVMLFITVYLMAAPRSATSQIERRALSQWPAFTFRNYFDGSYTSGISQFYDDTVPGRDSLKNIGNRIRSLFGISSENSVEVIGSIRKAEDMEEAETASPAETEPAIREEAAEQETTTVSSKDYHIDNQDVIDENGYLVVLQDGHWRAFALYVGVDISLYTDTINYVRQMIDPSINLYVMPAPLACQFYIPANYLDYHEDMENTFRDLQSRLVSKITPVDAINTLNEHNTEPIYLRTDHHWGHLGAYYAASDFAKAANVPFADLDTYEKRVREGYVGTMYALTGSANLLNDPEDFEYYLPTASYIADYYDQSMNYLFRKGLFFDTALIDSYGMVLGEDDLIIRVVTGTKNGRKLLLIKNSFGNAMVPFLTSSFEEIYVIDQRYFDFNLINYIDFIDVTDILFTHDYFSLTGAEAELLEYITYSNLDEKISDPVPKPEAPAEGNPDINGSETLFAEDVLGYALPPREEDDSEETDPPVINNEDVYYDDYIVYDDTYYGTYYDDTYSWDDTEENYYSGDEAYNEADVEQTNDFYEQDYGSYNEEWW